MSKRFFRLLDDINFPKRWHLDDPVDQHGHEVNPWQFSAGHPVANSGRLKARIYQRGTPLDYTTTPVGTTPIVHHRVAELFSRLAPDDIQLVPIHISRQKDSYYLINTLHLIKCIDDGRCIEVVRWLPEDEEPEKTGTYRTVAGLRIDPSKVGAVRIFRTWGWEVALIVSEEIKEALERLKATGPRFTEV